MTATRRSWARRTRDYPVRMELPRKLDRYSRVKTGFRIILAIPILVVRYVMQLMLEIGAIGAWFVIVFTGRHATRAVRPDGARQLLYRPFETPI